MYLRGLIKIVMGYEFKFLIMGIFKFFYNIKIVICNI